MSHLSCLAARIWLQHSVKSGILLFLLSQVVLKIIKHYQEEGQGSEVVQGVLLGLVVDDRLEITNCFPFPQHTEDDADFDEGNREQRFLSVLFIDPLLLLEKRTQKHQIRL